MYNNSLAALLCLTIICTDRAQAQTLINDTLLFTTAKKNIVAFYEKSIDVQAVIYSGHDQGYW